MSNDGSITVSSASQVRQFGLYRTIDARTEEFLRLSKKRQIKQGCACAAVSTAITVTIVVSVLLIYEFHNNSDLNLNKTYVSKANWLGWFNDSADLAPFEEKYSKMKFNFDKTTLKLLPVLLNVLNRNIHLDKIIDEYSSSSAAYDRKDTTELTYNTDPFNSLRNWYKIHPTRLYALEYKALPIVHYRSPTQSVEYFTKIRKIRDYQRIISYFDKMVSDKVGFNSAVSSARKELYKTERPLNKLSTLSMKNRNNINNIQNLVISNNSINNTNKQETRCKCPKKLGELLTKLISSISKLIPYVKLPITLCKEEPVEKKFKSLSNNIAVKEIETNTPPTIMLVKHLKNTSTIAKTISAPLIMNEQNKVIKSKVLHSPLNINILKLRNKKLDSKSDKFMPRDKSKTTKSYFEPTKTEKSLPTATKPLIPLLKNVNDYQSLHQVTTRNEYLKHKATIKLHNKFESKASVFDTKEYEDYFATTKNIINEFDTLEVDNLELFKTKMIYPLKKVEKVKIKGSPKSAIENSKYNSKDSKFRMTTSYQNDKDLDGKKLRTKLISKLKPTDLLTVLAQVPAVNLTETKLIKDNKFDNITNSASTNISSDIYTFTKLLSNENIILNGDKILQDELREIDNSNHTIDAIYTVNKTEAKLPEITTNITNDKMEAAILKEIIKTRNYNSMLPEDRPAYLEILRNEWRQDEHQDFDINFSTNLFDLTVP